MSDEKLEFTQALKLPMFEVDGMELSKRITMVVRDGEIDTSFYPLFPPDKNVDKVAAKLRSRR